MNRFAVVALHAAGVLTVAAPILALIGLLEAERRSGGLATLTSHALDRSGELGRNTAIAVAVAIPVAIGLGLITAAPVARARTRVARPLGFALVIAATFPIHVVANAWASLVPTEWVEGSPYVVGLIHALAHTPLVALLLAGGLRAVADRADEAAASAGAGAVTRIVRVALPRIRTSLFAAAVLVGLWTSTDFGIADRLLVRTYAEEVYSQFALTGSALGPLMASLPSVVIGAGLGSVLFFRIARRRRADEGRADDLRGGTPWLLWQAGAVVVALTLLLCPLLTLWGHVGANRSFLALLGEFAPELSATTTTAAGCAALCALMAPGLADAAVRRPLTRCLLLGLFALSLALPAPLIGLGWTMINSHLAPHVALVEGPLALVLPCVSRFLPIATLLAIPAVRRRPIEFDELPDLLGGPALFRWWHVVWRPAQSAALAGAFVAAILTVGELPLAILASPPGVTTISTRTFSLLHYGLDGDAAALCLLTVALLTPLALGLAASLFAREPQR